MNKFWENPGKTMGYLANGAFFVACRAYGSPFFWETMASTIRQQKGGERTERIGCSAGLTINGAIKEM